MEQVLGLDVEGGDHRDARPRCRDMEELCPQAVLLNYTNPMSIMCLAAGRVTTLPVVGLCHSVQETSHLLAPFPETMIDSAFFDRFHAYVPGWEIPKMRPEFFTNQYGLIVDYLAKHPRGERS